LKDNVEIVTPTNPMQHMAVAPVPPASVSASATLLTSPLSPPPPGAKPNAVENTKHDALSATRRRSAGALPVPSSGVCRRAGVQGSGFWEWAPPRFRY